MTSSLQRLCGFDPSLFSSLDYDSDFHYGECQRRPVPPSGNPGAKLVFSTGLSHKQGGGGNKSTTPEVNQGKSPCQSKVNKVHVSKGIFVFFPLSAVFPFRLRVSENWWSDLRRGPLPHGHRSHRQYVFDYLVLNVSVCVCVYRPLPAAAQAGSCLTLQLLSAC